MIIDIKSVSNPNIKTHNDTDKEYEYMSSTIEDTLLDNSIQNIRHERYNSLDGYAERYISSSALWSNTYTDTDSEHGLLSYSKSLCKHAFCFVLYIISIFGMSYYVLKYVLR